MQRAEVLVQVQAIIRDQLEDQTLEIDDATVVDDIPDWDSIAHVQIIVAIENRFAILCDPEEYTAFADVGEMVDSIAAKLAEKA